jgi:Fe-S cluster biogenesis protein NfuA
LTKAPLVDTILIEAFINFKGDYSKMQDNARPDTVKTDKVKEVLDKVRPYLVRDGGNVELVAVEDGTVKVKLVGACAGCPMSRMTLKNGIERILKQEIPEVKEVVAV